MRIFGQLLRGVNVYRERPEIGLGQVSAATIKL